MTEFIYCQCGCYGIESDWAKNEGYCPACKYGRADLVEKYNKKNVSRKEAA